MTPHGWSVGLTNCTLRMPCFLDWQLRLREGIGDYPDIREFLPSSGPHEREETQWKDYGHPHLGPLFLHLPCCEMHPDFC